MTVEIRTVIHADEIEQLTDLFASTYGEKASVKFWEWKYISNPLAHLMPEVVVALDGSKIVGVRPFWLAELWLGDRKVVGAQHCDTLVHPDYRRQGIFNRMGKSAIHYLLEHDCPLSYGFPGKMSRPGFLSQGYRILTPLELSFRLLKPGRLIGRHLPPRGLTTPLGNLLDRFYSPADIRLDDETRHFQVETWDSYSPDLCVLDSMRDISTLGLVRSETNLRWRFDTHPHNQYRYITVKRRGELCGYAVIQNYKEYSGLLAGLIMDYLVKDNDLTCFRTLIAKAMTEFRRTGCYAMSVWAFSDPHFQHELHNNLGFRSSKKFPYRKIMDTGYMDVLSLRGADSDVYDSTKWRINYAYPNFF
jgi:GNAT superfamily N-acetyltransferase